MHTCTPVRKPALLFALLCLVGFSGCGTNFDQVLYQTAGATGRTFFDVLLADLANSLTDSFDQIGANAPDQGGTTTPGDQSGGGTPPPAGPALGELTGVADVGQQFFLANVCPACHCEDAGGGCNLNAPSLAGVTVEMVDGRLRGDIAHPGGKFDFTNQDIVDLQAFFASLVPSGG